MDILSPLLKPKIYKIRGKFLLGLRLNIKITYLCFCINLNSNNTFTGNVIFDLHAVPGFGIATFFVAANETQLMNLEHITKLVVTKNLLLGRIFIMTESTTYRHLRRVQHNKSPMQELRRSSF